MGINARNEVSFRDVRVLFRNFAGKAGMYNEEGERTFKLVITPEMEAELAQTRLPWNIKDLKPRPGEEDLPRTRVLEVMIRWPKAGGKGSPPKCIMITSGGKTTLEEDMAGLLDWPTILTRIDVIIRPYNWGPNAKGETGTKAYLKACYATIEEDEFEMEYSDVPESVPGKLAFEPNTESDFE